LAARLRAGSRNGPTWNRAGGGGAKGKRAKLGDVRFFADGAPQAGARSRPGPGVGVVGELRGGPVRARARHAPARACACLRVLPARLRVRLRARGSRARGACVLELVILARQGLLALPWPHGSPTPADRLAQSRTIRPCRGWLARQPDSVSRHCHAGCSPRRLSGPPLEAQYTSHQAFLAYQRLFLLFAA
jgi:hypothetical protein